MKVFYLMKNKERLYKAIIYTSRKSLSKFDRLLIIIRKLIHNSKTNCFCAKDILVLIGFSV